MCFSKVSSHYAFCSPFLFSLCITHSLKGQKLPGAASTKSMQYPSAGPSVRGQVTNRNSSGALAAIEPAEAPSYDPLVGRKVMTRWPEDNSFYEAVITDYNPVEVCLVT